MRSLIAPNLYQIGTAVGLVSLSAFYIALILAYGLRIDAGQPWQGFRVPVLLWLSTASMVASSVLLESARRLLRRAELAAYRKRLLLTFAMASVFLISQATSGYQLLAQGVAAEANPHGSAFYVFMGLHATHLLGAVMWFGSLWRKSMVLESENDVRKHRIAAGAAAMYWHYMAALWLVLFYFLKRWSTSSL